MSQLSEPLATNISKAKVLLLHRFPFFGYLALSAPIRETEQVRVAGVTSNTIYVNPSFFNTITLQDQAQLIAHEVLHLALQHQQRRKWRKKFKWNVACDVVVNDIVESQGFQLLEGAIVKEGILSNKPSAQMNELNAETIYSMIPELNRTKDMLEDTFTSADLSEDIEGDNGEATNWEFQLKAAAKHAKLSYGDMPGWMEREIGITRPKFDWVSIMSYFVGSVSKQERSYRRLSRRHLWRNAIIPKGSNFEVALTIVIDASGSITPGMLNNFVSEINNISLTIDRHVRILVHDTVITLDTVARPGECRIKSIQGGGGTNFVPVIKTLEKNPPDGVIWFTDGYGQYPEKKPSFPLLWVLTRHSYEPPWGWVTKMET